MRRSSSTSAATFWSSSPTTSRHSRFAKLIYGFRDLTPPPDASAATRAFFNQIRPTQDWLARGGGGIPDQHEFLLKAYDLVEAIRQDLARSRTDPVMATLSSQTLQALRGMAFGWVTSSDNLQKWADAGKISKPLAKYAGFLSFGAEDLVQGIVGWTEHGTWQNPETAAHLLDAVNRGTWAAVGFMASGGNRQVADLFSSAAGFVGTFARDHTVDSFADAYMKFGGFDKAILDQYASSQQARLAHHQAPVSFEQFVHFDANILRAIDPTQRSAADARFGLRPPPAPPPDTTQVITRTTHEFYSDVCRSGFCVRTAPAGRKARSSTGASARLLSTPSWFPPSFFGRANRGLLTEARATEEAGASLATGTKRRSASALAATQPTNGAKRPEEGRSWCVKVEEAGADSAESAPRVNDRCGRG
jgi:hypothetical protein